MSQKRIWELDALRGLCILLMVLVHFVYDLSGLFHWTPGPLYYILKQWGGGVFFVISGMSITLGKHPVRRGLQVLGCGGLCSAATAGMYVLNLAGRDILIFFGTLHCLATCMLLWPLLRQLSIRAAAVLGCLLCVAGVALLLRPVHGPVWLLPFGILPENFATADYFPLLPFLGVFLLGTCLGQSVYAGSTGLFPHVNFKAAGISFLCLCGRNALPIYLLHQPVIACILFLLSRLP